MPFVTVGAPRSSRSPINVCGREKLVALEPAHGAVTLVGVEHTLAKLLLVQPLLHDSCRVAPADGRFQRFVLDVAERREAMFVHGHRERQFGAIIADDVHGILGGVSARDDAVKIGERCLQALRFPETDVVRVIGLRPLLRSAIPIAK
jgi:hypothetical protein